MTESQPLAELRASNGRRFFAWGTLVGLGGLLVAVAVTQPPAPGWQVFLVVLGAICVAVAERLRRATAQPILLFADGLRYGDGELIAPMSDIAKVERGVFAFKPSNGFVLHLSQPQPRRWAPGLWWRYGKRVGVGGVVSSGPAKYMAEQIALRMAGV